jgi:hypothetical protein
MVKKDFDWLALPCFHLGSHSIMVEFHHWSFCFKCFKLNLHNCDLLKVIRPNSFHNEYIRSYGWIWFFKDHTIFNKYPSPLTTGVPLTTFLPSFLWQSSSLSPILLPFVLSSSFVILWFLLQLISQIFLLIFSQQFSIMPFE